MKALNQFYYKKYIALSPVTPCSNSVGEGGFAIPLSRAHRTEKQGEIHLHCITKYCLCLARVQLIINIFREFISTQGKCTF